LQRGIGGGADLQTLASPNWRFRIKGMPPLDTKDTAWGRRVRVGEGGGRGSAVGEGRLCQYSGVAGDRRGRVGNVRGKGSWVNTEGEGAPRSTWGSAKGGGMPGSEIRGTGLCPAPFTPAAAPISTRSNGV
jgi:hypothetical protein